MRAGEALWLADSASQSIMSNRVSDVKCNHSDSESIWARYLNAPKKGTLIFRGNAGGQGAGNVLAGLSTALMVAMASRRELVVDYSIGGVQLSDIIPANKNGPSWKYVHHGSCGSTIRDFDFGAGNTKPEVAVKIAMDVTGNPSVCFEGNFGHGSQFHELLNAELGPTPHGAPYTGCSLTFLFDPTQVKTELESNVFNFVGHLRLGDAAMMGHSTSARGFISNPSWGLHTIDNAGEKIIQCMQGVARSLPELQNHRNCTITMLSDSSEMKDAIRSHSKNNQQPCTVIVSQVKAKHSDTSISGGSQVQDMFGDMFSLSQADAAMLTDSGFGIIGSALGPAMSQRSYSVEKFLKEYHELRTKAKAEQSFEDFCFSKASKMRLTFDDSLRQYMEAKRLWAP